MIGVLFLALVALSCGTATLIGGKDGRWIAFLYLLAIVGTHYARLAEPSWRNPHVPVFLVDTALLAGLVMVALTSRRYWPIWIAGLHLLTVASHASVWFAGAFNYRVYFVMESVWSPMKLVVLLLGVLMDQRRERDAVVGIGGDGSN